MRSPLICASPSACANRELPELLQQFTHCIAKPQLRGQRSVPPLPSCNIKRRAPAEQREGAFLAQQAAVEQVQLHPSLAGAGHVHAPRQGDTGCLGLGTGMRMRVEVQAVGKTMETGLKALSC